MAIEHQSSEVVAVDHEGKPVYALPAGAIVEVNAHLRNGDRIALPQGSMACVYRIHHNSDTGHTEFEWEGLAEITGAHNKLRWWRK